MLRRITCRVAGVSFADRYPEGLHALRDRPLGDFPLEGSLIREADNPYDKHAVVVLCGGLPVGHLPRSVAERVGPALDRGEPWVVREADVLVHPDHADRPGVRLVIERTDLPEEDPDEEL